MVKNKKLIIIFTLMIVFLFTMVTFTKASDDIEDLPIIDSDLNEQTPEPIVNNETKNQANNNIEKPINTNNDNTVANNNKLPQTGVANDTTLFIFIGVCIVSSAYAYIKIKKYNNI